MVVACDLSDYQRIADVKQKQFPLLCLIRQKYFRDFSLKFKTFFALLPGNGNTRLNFNLYQGFYHVPMYLARRSKLAI